MRGEVKDVSKRLEEQFQMKFIGFSESADDKFYSKIGLEFNVFRILSKDEGRKILIESTEEILKTINSNLDLEFYLKPFPFTPNNIDIALYVYQPDNSEVIYPNISLFTNWGGKIEFKTETEEMKYKSGYFTREQESYEQALNIESFQA